MAARKVRTARKAKLIFGEGKTEGAFLKHLKQLYRDEIRPRKIQTDHGNGGSPKTIALDLKRRHQQLSMYDGVMLWIDSDLPPSAKLLNQLKSQNVELLLTEPQCVEGFFLELLDDCPAGAATMDSATLKRRFNVEHLGTDDEREALRRLKKSKMSELFARSLLEQKRKTSTTLDSLLVFLGV
ncbi:MAG: hypothetical protein ACQKBY_08770 [Verrucomicrobiales bacterium]